MGTVGEDKVIRVLLPVVLVVPQGKAGLLLHAQSGGKLEIVAWYWWPEGSPTPMKPPPFQMKRRTAAATAGSSQTAPPVWAVSPSPLEEDAGALQRMGIVPEVVKAEETTSNGAPDSASMTPA